MNGNIKEKACGKKLKKLFIISYFKIETWTAQKYSFTPLGVSYFSEFYKIFMLHP
jgi:hypothetical protein